MLNLLKHPLLPVSLTVVVGLLYLVPHPDSGALGILTHMAAGLIAVTAFILHIRNQRRDIRSYPRLHSADKRSADPKP